MNTDHSPLKKAGVLDHGVTSAQFHAVIPVGSKMEITDEHMKRAMAVADRDFIGAQDLTFVTASNLTSAPVGLIVSHSNGEKLSSASRTLSLQPGSNALESAHAIIHPSESAMPFTPTTLQIQSQAGTRSNLVRTATARAARWNGADVDSLTSDIETVELDGKKRHLVPSVVTPTASPVTLLFHRNEANPGFMTGAYAEKNRKKVGDKFIVTETDMASATKSLRENLTPQSHGGLIVEAIPLHGKSATGEVTVAFNITRKPLTAECYADETAANTCFTVHDGLRAMGETITAEDLTVVGDDLAASVFKHDMHNE